MLERGPGLTVVLLVAATFAIPAGELAAEEPPAGLTRDGWSQIRRAVQESEYHATRVAKPGEASSLQALNRQQSYRTTFGRDGIEIVPQAPAGSSWRLGLSVTGYGYAGDVRPLESAEPQALKDRVEYRRGPVTEWYVNRPGGLEQGFALAEPRPRRAWPLVVTMAASGDLELSSSGDGVSFANRSGATLVRYAGLKAWDADGRTLRSRVEAVDREVRIVVDAEDARFPVTVDPTFVHEAQLFGRGDPIGQQSAGLGYAVSVSGNTAVVGAPVEDTPGGQYAGAAYVFVRSGTIWTEQQKLVASDGAGSDAFGSSASISGDTVIVGAPLDDLPGGQDHGSAYVFMRSGTAWTEQQKLFAADGAADDQFGHSVSISGDTAVVGAHLDGTPGGVDAGSAYVFVRSGTTWTQQQKLLAADGNPDDHFGTSVSITGDTALVGAPGDDVLNGPFNMGSVYVFVRSGTAWTLQQKLMASDGATNDLFGHSISLSGNTAVVGAYQAQAPAGQGAAYVFVRSGTTWTLQQKLLASDGSFLDYFGFSVSVFGDTAVVGSGNEAAYVFVRSGTTWAEQQKLIAVDGDPDDSFGRSVAVFADTVIAGAQLDNNLGGADTGSAYVFVRSGTTWSEQQKLLGSDHGGGDEVGYAVSISADTVVVGAPFDLTPSGGSAGSAYVFVRSGTTWTQQQKLLASDGAVGDVFGSAVSVSGDTAVVGAPADDSPGVNAGSAYVFVRSGTAWTQQQKLLASDGAQDDSFGFSVSVSGDTVLVGARTDDNSGGTDAGSGYVFVRSGVTWTQQQKLTAPDGAASDVFGISVSVSGSTAIVGAYTDTPLAVDTGSAYVFTRSGTTWGVQQKLLAPDGALNDLFGASVSIFGDTAVVGAYMDDHPGVGPDAGSAYVFVRSGTTWSQQQKLLASDTSASDNFGRAVSVSADTIVVGAPADDTATGLDAGAAYVFVRSGTTWTEQAKLLAPSVPGSDTFGFSVSVSGDTVMAGAPTDDTPLGGVDAGSVHVFREFVPRADLGITKTDGQSTAVPGQPLTYTIVVSNAGPDGAAGATVTDTLPGALNGATWTCVASIGSSCPASGSGNINATVNLLAVGTATFTVTGTVDRAATGALANTATIAAPPGVTDSSPANNSATDIDTLTPRADLTITKTDGQTAAVPGLPVTYTIVAGNAGPSDVTGAAVTDSFPVTLTSVSWTCAAAGGASCSGGGSGNINDTVNLPVGGTATYTATGTVDAGARGTLQNTAMVTAPGGTTDPNLANNSATDTDTLPGVDYFTLAPCRVVDTRGGAPIGGPVLQGQQTRTFAMGGNCGIPSTAKAISINLAVTQPTATGNIRLFPAGQPVPTVSSINYAAGQTRGNNAIISLDANGAMAAFVGQPGGTTVHLILDVNGYFE